MSNTLLTPTAVTRKALAVLHSKLSFISTINKQYDDSFAQSGAKIGSTLNIRLPNQYVVRSGATLSTQDTVETSASLSVSNQKGVDLNFTSADLTLSLDDFADRILEPAMATLASTIESDALSMVNDVYNQVNNQGSAATFAKFLQGRKLLVDNLAPADGRVCCLNTQDNVDMVDALKGLFNAQDAVSKQYKEGYLGRTAGFDFMENTILTKHTPGTGSGYLLNGASQSGATLTVDTGSGALKKGDVFVIAGVNRCHPETKADTGVQQQFVLTADATSGATSLAISPAIVTSGATQNVVSGPADNAAITFPTTNGTPYGVSLAYQKDAFTFATADLVMPKGVDFSAREVFDGISMRIVRNYDIVNDKFPCRLDVLYGYKTLRAQCAARIANN